MISTPQIKMYEFKRVDSFIMIGIRKKMSCLLSCEEDMKQVHAYHSEQYEYQVDCNDTPYVGPQGERIDSTCFMCQHMCD